MLTTLVTPTAATAAEEVVSAEQPGSSAEPAFDPVDKRVFVGRATLKYLLSLELLAFECPADAPWIDGTKRQNGAMPAGIEAGSGDIRGHVNLFTYRTRDSRAVIGWEAYWANTVTNWNHQAQDIPVYVHCTNDSAKAWSYL